MLLSPGGAAANTPAGGGPAACLWQGPPNSARCGPQPLLWCHMPRFFGPGAQTGAQTGGGGQGWTTTHGAGGHGVAHFFLWQHALASLTSSAENSPAKVRVRRCFRIVVISTTEVATRKMRRFALSCEAG